MEGFENTIIHDIKANSPKILHVFFPVCTCRHAFPKSLDILECVGSCLF